MIRAPAKNALNPRAIKKPIKNKLAEKVITYTAINFRKSELSFALKTSAPIVLKLKITPRMVENPRAKP
jgi:hypothetical protein